jgi:hypothetical protein
MKANKEREMKKEICVFQIRAHLCGGVLKSEHCSGPCGVPAFIVAPGGLCLHLGEADQAAVVAAV